MWMIPRIIKSKMTDIGAPSTQSSRGTMLLLSPCLCCDFFLVSRPLRTTGTSLDDLYRCGCDGLSSASCYWCGLAVIERKVHPNFLTKLPDDHRLTNELETASECLCLDYSQPVSPMISVPIQTVTTSYITYSVIASGQQKIVCLYNHYFRCILTIIDVEVAASVATPHEMHPVDGILSPHR